MQIKQKKALIRLENIIKRYGQFTALDGVSLDVYEGEFLALLGPSGCGKTTLLRTIGGFCEPSSGSLSIDGRDMSRLAPNERPVNTVFQNYALFPHMTISDNVAFGPRRHGVEKSQIDDLVQEALKMVGMANFAHRYPGELSGGQQQRVALARAIINKPKVLLLDEPLAALDLKLRKRMQMELKSLQEQLGITFVIVTHDQEEALVMADRIVVMSDGRIEQVGAGEDIYADPQSRFVADFIGEANLLECHIGANGGLRTTRGDQPLPYSVDAPGTTSVTLMIRPERIALEKADGPHHFQAEGTVREIIYAGAATRVFVDCEMADELVISLNMASMNRRLAPGQPLTFSWHRDDARVLTR
jgi:spermidine/putrescine transport system ATP-binding protein